jgi:hypothetical protein
MNRRVPLINVHMQENFFLFLLSLPSLKAVNACMTESCNKIFSDSTGDSSDSKMPFR